MDRPRSALIIERVNRFVVKANVDSQETFVWITNTGRLKELINYGARGICVPRHGGKTSHTLLGVLVGDKRAALIDTRTQAMAFEMAVEMRLIPWMNGWSLGRKNVPIEDSKIDYEIEGPIGQKGFLETKSAAYFDGYYSMYPDCPTRRGQRHVSLLRKVKKPRLRCVLAFIAAHPDAMAFRPSVEDDALVAREIELAIPSGVEIHAVKIHIDEDGVICLDDPDLPVRLPSVG